MMEVCFELIGVDVLYGVVFFCIDVELYEVCVCVVVCIELMVEVVCIGNEVEILLMCGLFGGGGVIKSVCEIIVVVLMLVFVEFVLYVVYILES